ncbi:hypothetical protein BOV88_13525 [Solemya velum gill symbiont]|uniref:Uncharacterized protein n=1 Tax=Solemya velum gill symbiont TaxID=2340 RepID=A0A1T2CG02_SOVGS|nr:hypothetical protein BOV88_13525 [Solemya velum gill symbiont]
MTRKQYSLQIVLYPPPWIEEPPSTVSEGKLFDAKKECLENLSKQLLFDYPSCYILYRESLHKKHF